MQAEFNNILNSDLSPISDGNDEAAWNCLKASSVKLTLSHYMEYLIPSSYPVVVVTIVNGALDSDS